MDETQKKDFFISTYVKFQEDEFLTMYKRLTEKNTQVVLLELENKTYAENLKTITEPFEEMQRGLIETTLKLEEKIRERDNLLKSFNDLETEYHLNSRRLSDAQSELDILRPFKKNFETLKTNNELISKHNDDLIKENEELKKTIKEMCVSNLTPHVSQEPVSFNGKKLKVGKKTKPTEELDWVDGDTITD